MATQLGVRERALRYRLRRRREGAADGRSHKRKSTCPQTAQNLVSLYTDSADAHRKLPEETGLNALFAEAETRVLREDFTFRYRNEHWQVEEVHARDLKPKQRVTVERRLDGSIHYRCGSRYLTPFPFVAARPPQSPGHRVSAGRSQPITLGESYGSGRRSMADPSRALSAPAFDTPPEAVTIIHQHRAKGHFYFTLPAEFSISL